MQIAPFDLGAEDTQAGLLGGRTGAAWAEGERVTGDRAIAIATTQCLEDLPWYILGSFPQGHVPEPPLIDENRSRTDKIRHVAGVYYRYLYDRRGRAAPAGWYKRVAWLKDALDFFTGVARPGIEEFYADSRRKVPEKISPHAWVRWSWETCWQLTEEGKRGAVASLEFIFAPARLQNPKTVNIFTHNWQALFPSAPIVSPRRADAQRLYDKMLLSVGARGFSSREELRTIAAPWEAELIDLRSIAQVEIDSWLRELKADHAKGGWDGFNVERIAAPRRRR
jgi:hypothetical protein